MRNLVSCILFFVVSNLFGQLNDFSNGGIVDVLDGNNTLGDIYNNSACGLNYTFNGVRLRQRPTTANGGHDATAFPSTAQPGTIAISSIPFGATILRAYLWFTVEHANPNTTLIANSLTGNFIDPSNVSTSITASLSGKGTGTCAFGGGSPSSNANYRADVTTLITGNGNYQVSGLPIPATAGIFTGNDKDTDGATLLIVYSDPLATYNGTIVIHDGTIVTNVAPTYSKIHAVNGYKVCPGIVLSKAFISITDLNSWVIGWSDTLIVNGVRNAFNDGKTYTSKEFTIPNSTVGCGVDGSTFQVKSAVNNDCFSINFAGIYLQRNNCIPCTNVPFTVNTGKTDPTGCGASNGVATATASGGLANYTYVWSNGSTTQTANGLSAGTYTVTVNDANCNITTQTVSLLSAGGLTVSPSKINDATCGNSDGVAQAFGTLGGTAPYVHKWSNSFTGDFNVGLSAGTYTVTAIDANGCTGTATVTIGSGCSTCTLTASGNVIADATCTLPGSATVSTSNGTSPYTYLWGNGSTSQTATGLLNGIYTVSVTDAQLCTATTVVFIAKLGGVSIDNINKVDATCVLPGSASVVISGGTTPFTYVWSNGVTTQSTSNLTPGIYTVTVSDSQSCTATATVTITSSSGVNIASVIPTSANCNGAVGSAIVNISNGSTGSYTYSWANGQSVVTTSTTQLISNLNAGFYTLTLIDGNCTATSQFNITQPNSINIGITKINATCDLLNGSINTIITGGTPIYTYSWLSNSGFISNNGNINNLASATYSLVVTDSKGCTASTNVIIINSGIPNATITTTTSTTIDEGSPITLIGSGGVSYSWSPPINLSCLTCPITVASPIVNTTYTLQVIDAFGCVDSAFVLINISKGCKDEKDVFVANVFSPNGDGKNDNLAIQGAGLTNVYWGIYDRWGNLLFETRDQAVAWDGTKNGSPLGAGTYVYYIKATCKKTLQEIILKGNVSIIR